MALEIEKILTDAPIIDELIYYAKIMALDTVIKDEDSALHYETLDIIKDSDLYVACIDGRASFLMFDDSAYTLDMMVAVNVHPIEIREACTLDKTLVPTAYRNALAQLAATAYIASYVEQNNYYRMLNGKPNVEDTAVYPTKFNQAWEPGIYIKEYDNLPDGLDLTIPIHKYDKSIIELLRDADILKYVIEDYPTKKYLNYLGDKTISIYDARTAPNFAILYVPEIKITELYHNFVASLEKNRVYCMKAVYNEAFKLESDYYNKFIVILIIIQSVIDTIINAPEYLIRRDVFDIRTIQYIFEGYDVEYFKEIPLKYQVAMVKNLNKLLKYKSTTKNLVDICNLFGFEDINIFKYYLLKDRRKDSEGNFVYNYKQIQDPAFPDDPTKTITVEDNQANYDLKFFKTPIDGDMEDYIRDPVYYSSYDDITLNDMYWDGDREHADVKADILEHEFNILQSKYVSIDSVYHLTNLSFERPYFFSILFEEDKRADGLKMTIPYLSVTKLFRFTDIICFLYALMYEYYGIVDSIMDTTTKVMAVKGFNFKANFATLAQYLSDNNTSMEELGMPEFKVPEGSILTFGQLLEIYTNNENIYNHLEDGMANASDYNIYRIYKTIYDSLMICNENLEFFRKSDGNIATSYSDFISDRDIFLYSAIQDIKSISTIEERQTAIIDAVSYTISGIDAYLDTDEYKHLFSNMPTESASAVQKYIYKVINFFKSYKIDIVTINNIYKLEDGTGKANIIDKKYLDVTFDKNEDIKPDMHFNNIDVTMTKGESIKYIDDMTKYACPTFSDPINMSDIIGDLYTTMGYSDVSIFNEVFTPTSTLTAKDNASATDRLWIEVV